MSSKEEVYIIKLEEMVENLKQELFRVKEENKRSTLQKQKQEIEITSLKKLNEEQVKDIEGLREEIKLFTHKVELLLQKIKDLEGGLDYSYGASVQMKDNLSQLNGRVQNLTQSLDQKDQIIRELEEANRILGDKNSTLVELVEEKVKNLAERSLEMRSYQKLKEFEKRYSDIERDMERLTEENRMKDLKYSLLEQDLQELTKVK